MLSNTANSNSKELAKMKKEASEAMTKFASVKKEFGFDAESFAYNADMLQGMLMQADYVAATSVGLGAAAKTTASTAGKSLGGIGFGIVAAFEIAEWLTTDDPFNNWSDLWIGLGSSAIKAVIATAVGLATAALVVAGGAAIVVIGVGVVVAVVASFTLEWIDRKFAITDRAKGYINELGY